MIYSHLDTLSRKISDLNCISKEGYQGDDHSLCENISIHVQKQRLNMEQKQQHTISPLSIRQNREVEAKFIFNVGV